MKIEQKFVSNPGSGDCKEFSRKNRPNIFVTGRGSAGEVCFERRKSLYLEVVRYSDTAHGGVYKSSLRLMEVPITGSSSHYPEDNGGAKEVFRFANGYGFQSEFWLDGLDTHNEGVSDFEPLTVSVRIKCPTSSRDHFMTQSWSDFLHTLGV
jgi:hypothetical protein